MSTTFTLAIKAPLSLPEKGVTSVAFKAHISALTPFLEQDVVNYYFFEGVDGIYATWTAKQDGQRIASLAVADPDKLSLDAKLLTIPPITNLEYRAKSAELLKRRNSQLAKFIHLTAVSTHYTEHADINELSTSFDWIVKYLQRHYNIETKGAHFLVIAKILFKKGDHPQTFYKRFRAQIQDNLRKKGEVMIYKNNQELREDEVISSSFECTIVLWCLEKIDPRLPTRVSKLYGHQMTGNKTLFDLQSTIFQDIPSILLDLDSEEHKSTLGATKVQEEEVELNYVGNWDENKNKFGSRGRNDRNFRGRGDRNFRGRGDRNLGGRRQPDRRPAGPQSGSRKAFCRMCKLAGSSPSLYNSHEIGECELLTRSDLGSIVRLNSLDEDEGETEKPTPFNEPGWDDDDGQDR